MRFAYSSAALAALLLSACDFEPSSPQVERRAAGPDTLFLDPGSLPSGKSYLVADIDSAGTPRYVPVEFRNGFATVEGDILVAFGEEEMEKLKASLVDPTDPGPSALKKASGLYMTDARWDGPKTWPGGYIRYDLDISLSALQKETVLDAIFEFNQTSPIGIVPVTAEDLDTSPRIRFYSVPGSISSSGVGWKGGTVQPVTVGTSVNVPTLVHELGHAAGLLHEHTRSDRDTYISFATSGTDLGKKLGGPTHWNTNYAIQTEGTTRDGAYDKASIMHYQSTTVSWPNYDGTTFKITISAKDGTSILNTHLSAGDRSALLNLQRNHSPFRIMQNTLGEEAGFSRVYMVRNPAQSLYHPFMARYNPSTGNVVTWPLADRDYKQGAPAPSKAIGASFTHMVPCRATVNKYVMMFYNKNTGAYKFYNLAVDGTVSTLIQSGNLAAGWDIIEPFNYQVQSFYLHLQNPATGRVIVHSWKTDGTLNAALSINTMPGWSFAKYFYLEVNGLNKTYCLYRNHATGKTRVQNVTSSGAMGGLNGPELFLFPGSGNAAVYSSGSGAHLMLGLGLSVLDIEIGTAGIRDNGTPIRSTNAGGIIKRMDATGDVSTTSLTGHTVNGRVLCHRGLVSLTFTEAPTILSLVQGVPFQ